MHSDCALRDYGPDDPEVEELAHEVAELLPRTVLPDEASPPDRLELFLGRRFGSAQVRCLHLVRALLDGAESARKPRSPAQADTGLVETGIGTCQ